MIFSKLFCVVCWMFCVGFHYFNICRDIAQSSSSAYNYNFHFTEKSILALRKHYKNTFLPVITLCAYLLYYHLLSSTYFMSINGTWDDKENWENLLNMIDVLQTQIVFNNILIISSNFFFKSLHISQRQFLSNFFLKIHRVSKVRFLRFY